MLTNDCYDSEQSNSHAEKRKASKVALELSELIYLRTVRFKGFRESKFPNVSNAHKYKYDYLFMINLFMSSFFVWSFVLVICSFKCISASKKPYEMSSFCESKIKGFVKREAADMGEYPVITQHTHTHTHTHTDTHTHTLSSKVKSV